MANDPGHKKLYQQVARAVGESIRKGEFVGGSRLPSERELAERFGVSRPTVREAMIALEIQGFLEVRRGSGIHVTTIAPKEAEEGADLDVGPFELTEARLVVEGEACALAALSIEESEIAELRDLLAVMDREATAPRPGAGPSAGEAADRRFHMLIAQATRNSALVSAVELLWDLRYRSPLCVEMLARAYDAGDRPRIDEHHQIVEALAARDSRAARAAMRLHLSRVIDGVLAATENEAVRRAREEASHRREIYARRSTV